MARSEKRIPHMRIIKAQDIKPGMWISRQTVDRHFKRDEKVVFRFIENVHPTEKKGSTGITAVISAFNKGVSGFTMKEGDRFFLLVNRRRSKKRGLCGQTA